METKYTVEELASKLKVSKKTILREIKRGKLETEKVGRRHLIPESSLTAYLQPETGEKVVTKNKTQTNKGLSKEHVYQGEDDDCCGPCSLQMVYSLKGLDVGLEQLLKELKLGSKGECTYPPQLARNLLEHGVASNLLVSNSQFISPAWKALGRRDLMDNLKSWLTLQPKHEWHLYGLHTLFYLEDGGNIETKPLDVDLLKKLIDRGSTLIVCVDEVLLWGHRFSEHKSEVDDIRGKSYGHFVVVKSYTGKKFKIMDPYPTGLPEKDGEYEMEGVDLVNAVLTWSGTIIEVLE